MVKILKSARGGVKIPAKWLNEDKNDLFDIDEDMEVADFVNSKFGTAEERELERQKHL